MINKLIVGILASLILGACSFGNVTNLNETDTDAKIKFISAYNTTDIQEFLTSQIICKTGNDIDKCNKNKDNLAKQFNFNLDQIGKNNAINKINAYTVVYQTIGLKGEPRTVSGGILVPNTDKDKIKGIVLFYHPTDVSKFNMPSCFLNAQNLPGYCHISNTVHGSVYVEDLGGIFASQGYVVVMPDYIGQGIDSSIMHPYIAFPRINAKTGIDMLPSVRQLLKNLGFENSTRFAVFPTGYSEGGAYSLWASKLLQNSEQSILSDNNFSLGLTAPISGAYDLSGAQIPLQFANVKTYPHADKYKALATDELTQIKPIVSTYYLTALAYYAMNKKFSEVFDTDYLNCGRFCKIGDEQYTITELLNSTNPDLNVKNISSAINRDANDSINSANNLAYGPDNNSISSFTASGLQKNKTFIKIAKQGDIVNWKTYKPVSFIALDYDSVVTPLNTANAYNALKKSSDKNLIRKVSISNFDYMTSIGKKDPNDLEPIDHMGCRVFLFIAALQEFNNYSIPTAQ